MSSSSSSATTDLALLALPAGLVALALALDTVAMMDLFFRQTLNPCQVAGPERV
jgi:hypothetical protein